VIAGVVQTLGFIRWVFLVPILASAYLDPSTTASSRAAIEVTFNAFNQYAGVGIGEHLGYLFTALWSLLVAVSILKSARFKAWVGWIGIFSAVGILVGILEPAGVPVVGIINAMAYILWAVWLIVVGVIILRVKVER
jgi:hypothetical protein